MLRSYRAQLTAIHGWGTQQPADLSVIGQSAAPPTQAVRQLGGTFGVALAIASLGISGAIDAGFDRIWWIVMIGGLATSALVLPMRTSSAHVHVAVAVVASPALTVPPGSPAEPP